MLGNKSISWSMMSIEFRKSGMIYCTVMIIFSPSNLLLLIKNIGGWVILILSKEKEEKNPGMLGNKTISWSIIWTEKIEKSSKIKNHERALFFLVMICLLYIPQKVGWIRIRNCERLRSKSRTKTKSSFHMRGCSGMTDQYKFSTDLNCRSTIPMLKAWSCAKIIIGAFFAPEMILIPLWHWVINPWTSLLTNRSNHGGNN